MIRHLGYACQNITLNTKTRNCVKKTFLEKGVDHILDLILINLTQLEDMVRWNAQHKIFLFRVSSEIFPWKAFWSWPASEKTEIIKAKLLFIGKLAKELEVRLTMHPGPYNCLGSPNPEVVANTIAELDEQSDFFNLLGYPPSHENPVNIHLGGAYGAPEEAKKRWIENFSKLALHTQKRLTIENDDRPSLYSVEHLQEVVEACKTPIKFDFHHFSLHPGTWALEKAVAYCAQTWGEVVPVFHYSESKKQDDPLCKSATAHSYLIKQLPQFEPAADLMIEAKGKELAILTLRNGLITE